MGAGAGAGLDGAAGAEGATAGDETVGAGGDATSLEATSGAGASALALAEEMVWVRVMTFVIVRTVA